MRLILPSYFSNFLQHLLDALQSPKVDVNLIDQLSGDGPIHSIIKRKKKDRVDLLLALLVNSKADINLQNRRSMTALHSAIEVRLLPAGPIQGKGQKFNIVINRRGPFCDSAKLLHTQ